MPPYAAVFQQRVAEALKLALAGEAAAQSSARAEWRAAKVEYLYEMSFLRAFIEWEIFLEQTFLRYLCGYQSSHGLYVPIGAAYCSSLPVAERLVFGRGGYALWHDPAVVARRANRYLVGCPHEVIVQANQPRLQMFGSIRHRVAHGQDNAKQKFDVATMTICGRRYRAARPGRFLRDWDTSTYPRQRWLEVISLELVGMATQIA
jgi:hypothetical protein